jgi:serine/threonine protein kinase
VQFLGAVTQSSPMMIVMEFMPKGDLRKHLSRKGALEPSYAVKLALDIARFAYHDLNLLVLLFCCYNED